MCEDVDTIWIRDDFLGINIKSKTSLLIHRGCCGPSVNPGRIEGAMTLMHGPPLIVIHYYWNTNCGGVYPEVFCKLMP